MRYIDIIPLYIIRVANIFSGQGTSNSQGSSCDQLSYGKPPFLISESTLNGIKHRLRNHGKPCFLLGISWNFHILLGPCNWSVYNIIRVMGLGESTISMAISNSYVELPEGNSQEIYQGKTVHIFVVIYNCAVHVGSSPMNHLYLSFQPLFLHRSVFAEAYNKVRGCVVVG